MFCFWICGLNFVIISGLVGVGKIIVVEEFSGILEVEGIGYIFIDFDGLLKIYLCWLGDEFGE